MNWKLERALYGAPPYSFSGPYMIDHLRRNKYVLKIRENGESKILGQYKFLLEAKEAAKKHLTEQ